jgi:2-amino-4-hydroxy-6-hydroxymethyldihydropteridine diphosphokinase/dihydropteroate synthase
MKTYLGLGSNEGDRKANLEIAVSKIQSLSQGSPFRVSPLFETPALLPDKAPNHWNIPFLNLVIETAFYGSPQDTLASLKAIEKELGRATHEHWSPRAIDIDILLWENREQLNTDSLRIPHPRMKDRAFVLDPLKELTGLPEHLYLARKHPQHSPIWMGILNLTPDSFSDEKQFPSEKAITEKLDLWDEHFVGIIDVGAESTRPGASPVDTREEQRRLGPTLSLLRQRYQDQWIRPQISVDTRHAETASFAIEMGADIINDVSGLVDPVESRAMIEVLLKSEVQYVLMHSLSISGDPTSELLSWFQDKASALEKAGIARHRIILDPGIGFGKSSLQSLQILRNMDSLAKLPYRLLVAHSRKSFLNPFTAVAASERDLETMGVSLKLARDGVDILRVHEPVSQIRAFRAFNHVNRSQP